MKILYIITQGEHGGGQKHVLDLAVGMKERGNDIYVAVGKKENENDNWLHEELLKNNFQNDNLLEIKNLQREIKIIKDVKSLFEIRKLIKQIKPDIVHLHSSKAGFTGTLASVLVRTKSIYTVHGFVFLEPMNFVKKILYVCVELFSSILRNFTILISQIDIAVGRKFFILRDKDKYKLIYNGIDENIKDKMLEKEEARKYIFEKIANVDAGQKIVGSISNLYKTKGLEYFIDAAAGILAKPKSPQKEILFVIFGFGDKKYQKELQDRINKNNLDNNFFLLGKIPNAYKYLKGLDLFTLTSVKEGLPYCLLEASIANLPIVATSVGGITPMSKNISMTLVPSKNVEAIENAILENLQNLETHKSEFNTIYSIENMLNQTFLIYEKMLK